MPDAPRLEPKLGTWDGMLITIGAVVGSGIFMTTGSMAAALPHPGLLLFVWVAAGALVFAGCQTYAELGTLFPRAGGVYHFLKETYGPLPGFLFGWTSFLVIMSGGIAAIASGFGEYLGTFAPLFSSANRLFTVPIGSSSWSPNGAQAAGVMAILALTVVNHFGVRPGALVQNGLTVLKLGAIAAFVAFGLLVTAPASPAPPAATTLPSGALPAALGVAMIGALWTYDGWYGLTFSAEELKDPARSLPRGMIAGVLAVVAVYTLVNTVYLRALPIESLAQTPRVGETAARALFGPPGERLISGAIVLSTFGCLSATILYSSRIYFPMAQDGLFFRTLAAVHPKYRTPSRSLWARSAWSMLLVLSGSYEQLYTNVTFAAVAFHAATGAAVFVLRARRPGLPRPYRAWGYPVVPALFVLGSAALVVNTLVERPRESLVGLGLIALGVPAFFAWRRRCSLRRDGAV
jgi:APA family basic amino acid/polyamine antiporter